MSTPNQAPVAEPAAPSYANETCGRCQFWHADQGNSLDVVNQSGECRHGPMSVQLLDLGPPPVYVSFYPHPVCADKACSRFQLRQGEPLQPAEITKRQSSRIFIPKRLGVA